MQVMTRGVAVALLLGCVTSAVALSAHRADGTGRPAATPTMASNEKIQAAIASGKLLFVGASYTVGLGATTSQAGYAPVLASHLDRRYTVAAVSGTGFLNPGPGHQGTFGERIGRLPSDLDPRIVVIQGGRNDAAYPQPALQAAARDTISLAQHRFTHAQVVVMGPIPAAVPIGPRLLQTRDIVRAAARQTHAGFVDPIGQGWITRDNEDGYAGPVPFHPNDAGYRYIARRLLEDLPAALEQSQPPLQVDAPVQDAPTLPGGVLPGAPVARDPEPRASAGEQAGDGPPTAGNAAAGDDAAGGDDDAAAGGAPPTPSAEPTAGDA